MYKKLLFLIISVQILLTQSSVIKNEPEGKSHPDLGLTIEQLITKYGFPYEEHDITTKDGYILQAHRIPHGRSGPPANKLGVVWLHHGLFSSSVDYIQNTVEKALAYKLADAGYDVWMGNSRGNRFSRRHTTLNPDKDSEYWQFSWGDMGTYDFPAVIDYTLEVTGEESLFFVGHSMGGAFFFSGMATHPKYNSKIRAFLGMAPAVHLDHMTSPIRLLAPIANDIHAIAQKIGIDEFLGYDELFAEFGSKLCAETSPYQEVCTNILFLIGGYNSEQVNRTQLPVIMQHVPAGQSAMSIVHLAQSINNKQFQRFNFGKEKNLLKYGQEAPPLYDISKITCPVAVYSGVNDLLVHPEDVERTSTMISNPIGIGHYRVNHPAWNHLDFIWGVDADTLLYNHMMDIMLEY